MNNSSKAMKPPLDPKHTVSTPIPSKVGLNASSLNQPFLAPSQAAASSLMSCPDPDVSIQDHLVLNHSSQTQPLISSAYNTPDNVVYKSPNVFDSDSDIKIDPLNQSSTEFDTSAGSFVNYQSSNPAAPSHENSHDVEGYVCPPGSEATGRWTKKEHELFKEGLKKYGKEWKKVAAMVKTRTVVQTRTHAQKYFQKVSKNENVAAGSGILDVKRPRSQVDTKEVEETKPINSTTATTKEDTNGNGDDYYYYDSELPSRKRQTTYYKNGSTLQHTKTTKEDDIPPPSPASCGKRKDAEISAVMSLMGSSPSAEAMEKGIHTLARMRSAYRKPVSSSNTASSPLSIINPDTIPTNESDNPPDTPWDGEMLALESRQKRSNFYIPLNEASSAEQESFLNKIRSLIFEGDPLQLSQLLEAAKLPEEPDMSSKFFIAGDIGNANVDIAKSVPDKESHHMAKEKRFSPKSEETKPSFPVIAEMLNRLDENGNSTLHLACGANALDNGGFHSENIVMEMCKILIDYGAAVGMVNSKCQTCVHLAALLRYNSVVNLLLLKGCPVNQVDENGDCATHLAARLNDLATLSLLTNCGANCHIRNKGAKCALDLLDDCVEKNMNRHEMRKELLSIEPRLRTLVLYHEDCLEHAARRESDWEGPDRLEGIMSSLHNEDLFPSYEVEISDQFHKAHVELLSRVHCSEYIAFVNSLSKKVQEASSTNAAAASRVVPFTPQVQMKMFHQNSSDIKADVHCDTSFSAGTLKAARRAAGAVAHAVDRVLLGRNRNAFCVVRPPGHHAGYRGLLDGAKSCGFCIFNNVAAGAFHALETHNCERVAIIDIDIHHGNGTEDIVRRYPHPSRVFFFSVHLYDKKEDSAYEFFPGSGNEDDTTHNIINVPLLPLWCDDSKGSGTRSVTKSSISQQPRWGREAYRQAISQRLIPALRAFSPDLILLSTGFDAAEGDVGNVKNEATPGVCRGMDLRPIDFEWTTTELLKVADLCCNGRVVSVLEGGYGSYSSTKKSAGLESGLNRKILSQCSASHVDRLIDPYGQNYENS